MTKSYFNCLKSTLKFLDFYGSSILLNIKGKQKYTTPLGGVLTITTAIIAIFFFIYFMEELISRSKPGLKNYKQKIEDKSFLPPLTQDNFFLAFQLLYPNMTKIDFNDNPYFGIQLHEEKTDRLFHQSYSYNSIPYGKCNITKLDSFANITTKYKNYIKDNFICMHFENNEIYGSPFVSIDVTSFRLHVNFKYKKLLADNDDNVNALYTKGIFPLNMRYFYQSYSYNPNNYDDPFQKVLAFSDLNVTFTEQTRVIAGFDIGESERDDNWLWTNSNISYLYGFNAFQVLMFNNDLALKYSLLGVKGYEKVDFLQSLFYIEYYKNVFQRDYVKIQYVLAQVSAMVKAFFITFTIIGFVYNSNRINEQLAYKFFKYNPETNYNIIIKNRKVRSSGVSLNVRNVIENKDISESSNSSESDNSSNSNFSSENNDRNNKILSYYNENQNHNFEQRKFSDITSNVSSISIKSNYRNINNNKDNSNDKRDKTNAYYNKELNKNMELENIRKSYKNTNDNHFFDKNEIEYSEKYEKSIYWQCSTLPKLFLEPVFDSGNMMKKITKKISSKYLSNLNITNVNSSDEKNIQYANSGEPNSKNEYNLINDSSKDKNGRKANSCSNRENKESYISEFVEDQTYCNNTNKLGINKNISSNCASSKIIRKTVNFYLEPLDINNKNIIQDRDTSDYQDSKIDNDDIENKKNNSITRNTLLNKQFKISEVSDTDYSINIEDEIIKNNIKLPEKSTEKKITMSRICTQPNKKHMHIKNKLTNYVSTDISKTNKSLVNQLRLDQAELNSVNNSEKINNNTITNNIIRRKANKSRSSKLISKQGRLRSILKPLNLQEETRTEKDLHNINANKIDIKPNQENIINEESKNTSYLEYSELERTSRQLIDKKCSNLNINDSNSSFNKSNIQTHQRDNSRILLYENIDKSNYNNLNNKNFNQYNKKNEAYAKISRKDKSLNYNSEIKSKSRSHTANNSNKQRNLNEYILNYKNTINNNNINKPETIKKAKLSITSVDLEYIKRNKTISNVNNNNNLKKKSFAINFLKEDIAKNQNKRETNKSSFTSNNNNIDNDESSKIKEMKYSEWNRVNEKLSFANKLRKWLCKKDNLSEELQSKLDFYEKSCKRVEERMDIINILTKLYEFDYFKMLFLNPFQALCMRYLKKPNISNINITNVIDFYEKFTTEKSDRNNIQKIIDYFEEKINNNNLDIMDKKLLELLDPEIKKTIVESA